MNYQVSESQQHYDVLQKWELPFRDLLDEIYYPGYSAELLENYPDEYAREYWYFIKMYS